MKKDFNSILTYGFYILLVLTGLYDEFFRDGEKIPRILLIFIVVLGIRIIFRKTFLKKYNAAYVIALIFVVLSMYLANVFGFYGIPNYDKYLHILSGVLLGFMGLILFMHLCNDKVCKDINKMAPVVFIVIFSIACAGGWEIWEFTTDSLFGLCAQNNSLNDTMWDIICGTCGSFIPTFLTFMHLKGKNIKIIKSIMSE